MTRTREENAADAMDEEQRMDAARQRVRERPDLIPAEAMEFEDWCDWARFDLAGMDIVDQDNLEYDHRAIMETLRAKDSHLDRSGP